MVWLKRMRWSVETPSNSDTTAQTIVHCILVIVRVRCPQESLAISRVLCGSSCIVSAVAA